MERTARQVSDQVKRQAAQAVQAVQAGVEYAKQTLKASNNPETLPRLAFLEATKVASNALRESSQLYDLVTGRSPARMGGTVYDELMRKEARVLKTINQVIEERRQARRAPSSLLDAPVRLLPLNLLRAIQGLFADLADVAQQKKGGWPAVRAAFLSEHRLSYMGLVLVAVAVFLMIVEISDHP